MRGSWEVAGNSEALLRLRDANGTIRVKIGGSAEGSGLILYDDSTESGVHMLAKRTGASIALHSQGGQRRIIQP